MGRPIDYRPVALVVLLGLGGCTFVDSVFGISDQQSKTITVQTVISACDTFQVGLQAATVAKEGHLLAPATIAKIDGLIPPVQAICPPQGHMPSGPIDALVVVVTNTAAIIAAIKGE